MRRAFTLIELLVVIGIILILTAVALPRFLDTIVLAKVARAEMELRVLGDSVEHYRTDFPDYPKSIFADLGEVEIELGIFASLPMLTSPVPYLTELPMDPFTRSNYQYFSTLVETISERVRPFEEIYGSWAVLSVGPDEDINLNAFTARLIHYAPTNGTLSRGDIVRSQRESRFE